MTPGCTGGERMVHGCSKNDKRSTINESYVKTTIKEIYNLFGFYVDGMHLYVYDDCFVRHNYNWQIALTTDVQRIEVISRYTMVMIVWRRW